MDKARSHAPIIAAVLLLLLTYGGCYLALVNPEEEWFQFDGRHTFRVNGYRIGSRYCATIFWPLEQIDRRYVRPGAWELSPERYDGSSSAP
jgi:hypothetical protein